MRRLLRGRIWFFWRGIWSGLPSKKSVERLDLPLQAAKGALQPQQLRLQPEEALAAGAFAVSANLMQLFFERLQTLFKGVVHAGSNSRGGGVLQRGNFNGEWRAGRPRSQEGDGDDEGV